MTKEQREECERIAESSVNRNILELHEADARVRKFKEGYATGVTSERKRAQVLVEALEFYKKIDNYPYAPLGRSPGYHAEQALSSYQKGTSDE